MVRRRLPAKEVGGPFRSGSDIKAWLDESKFG